MTDPNKYAPIDHVTYLANTDLNILSFVNESGSAHEIALWAAFIAPMFDFEMADPAACRGRTTTVFLGDMALSMTHTTGGKLNRTPTTIAKSGLDNFAIVQYHSGRHHLETERGATIIEPGDFVAFDFTKTASLSIETHSNSNLLFSRKSFEALVVDVDRVHGTVMRRGDAMNGILSSFLLSLTSQVLTLSSADAGRVANAAMSLFAAGFAGEFQKNAPLTPRQTGVSLEKIRAFIEDNLSDPRLNADLLLEHFPVSRSVLYKLFEPLGGVQSYVRKRRLSSVFKTLASASSASHSIGDIAAQWGFDKSSTFNRLFRDTFGVTPKALRETAKGAGQAKMTLKDEEDIYLRFLSSLAAISKPMA